MLLDSEVTGSVGLFCWWGVRAERCCKLTGSSLLAQIQYTCRWCMEFRILASLVNFKTQASTCVLLILQSFLLTMLLFTVQNSLGVRGLDSFQIKLKWKVHSRSSLGALQTLKGVHCTGPDQNKLEISPFEMCIVWKGVFSTNHFFLLNILLLVPPSFW